MDTGCGMADELGAWLGVMRHGETFRPGMDPETRSPGSPLTKQGLHDAKAVARRCRETLDERRLSPEDVTVAHSATPEAEATAMVLADALGGCRPVPLTALNPAPQAEVSWENVLNELADTPAGNHEARPPVLLVVGHDPQTSWLLHDLVDEGKRGQRWSGPLPLARGELAMLTGPDDGPWTLQWVLSPSDGTAITELQDKIRSKMDTAKLLGAFLTAVLLLAARELAGPSNTPDWYPWVAGGGLVLLGMGTAAYFVTMLLYDTLLMPVRFWPSPRAKEGRWHRLPRGFVRRPPSPASWVLYQNMMRVWSHAFIPATLLGAVGTLAVVVALAQPSGTWWWWVLVAAASGVLVTFLVWRAARPNLGVSD